MKKILIGLAAIVVLLVAAVFVAPSLINWKSYEPEIAKAVRDATGRELRIEGDISVSLVPLELGVSDIHLSNAEGMSSPEMISVASVTAKLGLLPLLRRSVVVNSLVVREPAIFLEVDENGRPNWAFEPAAAVAEPAEAPSEEEAGLPISDLHLGDVRIEEGLISYIDASSGQTVQVRDSSMKVALADLGSPFTLTGRLTLNDEPVALDVSVDSPKAMLGGERAKVTLTLASKHMNAAYDGAVQQHPVPGLDGTFDLDIPSVGELAAWLGRPLDAAQPDPGPLQVHAALAADGAKIALEEATIQGAALEAKASGSFDGSREIAKVVLFVESGVLDIDRYLPPPSPEAKQAAEKPEEPARPGGALAALPGEPFDLSLLRQTEADVKVAIGGVKAMGYELGRVAFATSLKGGVLAADLSELALYGGNVTGMVTLDDSGDALGVAVALAVKGVDVGKLAEAATSGEAPVAGTLATDIEIKGQGANPRALVESLAGNVAIDLGGVDVKDAPVGAISEVKLNVALPGLENPPSLEGSVVYNKQRVNLDVTLDPLSEVLSGERFALTAAAASKLVNVAYDGAVQQQPLPGLDGTFDLDIPSVGKLAAWLGQPLDKAQPDPGPLKVHAAVATDGPKVVLEEATIKGKALDARATGSFDVSQKVALFTANVDIERADLNAYLPPSTKEAAPAKKGPATEQAAGWSEEPFDLSALRQANGEAKITIGTMLYKDLAVRNGRITIALAKGVLKAAIEELQMADGKVDIKVMLDASGPAAVLAYQASIAGVEAQPLLKSFADTDRLSGKANFQTGGHAKGRNQKQFVETLSGDGSFKFLDGAIHGINLGATLRKAKTLGFGAEGDEPQKTDFAELSGSFLITNGLLENRDFKMLAPLLRVQGEGTVPLPPQTVDYRAEVKLVATAEGQGGEDALAGLPIPVRITGSWSNPSYGVDWQSVFNAAAMDPSRLANMPDDLRKAAEGFGVSLPIPELPGGDVLGVIPKTLPGLGGSQETSAETTEPSGTGGVVEQLQQLLEPKSEPTPEQPKQEEEPALPDPLESLKSLFGD